MYRFVCVINMLHFLDVRLTLMRNATCDLQSVPMHLLVVPSAVQAVIILHILIMPAYSCHNS